MVLTSERPSRHSPVKTLWNMVSKSAPKLSVFTDFDLSIALSPQSGVDFVEHNFKKCFKTLSF